MMGMMGLQAVLCVLLVVFPFVVAKSKFDNDLLQSLSRGDLSGVRAAVESGADVNFQGPGGQTPLMSSVLQGQTEIVKYLLGLEEVDRDLGEENGYTPMHGAGFQGRADVARVLADAGVPVDSIHNDGFTPVMRACWGNEKRHTDTVRVLAELGADIWKRNNGQDCLSMTKNKRTKKLIKSLKSKEKSEL